MPRSGLQARLRKAEAKLALLKAAVREALPKRGACDALHAFVRGDEHGKFCNNCGMWYDAHFADVQRLAQLVPETKEP